MKKRTIIALSLLLTAAAVLAVMVLTKPKEIDGVYFYEEDHWPYREVSSANKDFIREIYRQWSPRLSEIRAAEDSRSRKCMRILFLSEQSLDAASQTQILDEIFAHMNGLQDSNKAYPHYWEIFFAQGRGVYSAYVSRHGTSTRRTDPNARFQPWEEVPDAENWLTLDTVQRLLETTDCELYTSSELPICEMTPQLATD